jgi:hypothetical protein
MRNGIGHAEYGQVCHDRNWQYTRIAALPGISVDVTFKLSASPVNTSGRSVFGRRRARTLSVAEQEYACAGDC